MGDEVHAESAHSLLREMIRFLQETGSFDAYMRWRRSMQQARLEIIDSDVSTADESSETEEEDVVAVIT